MLMVRVQGHRNVYRKVKMQSKHDWKCPQCGAYIRYYWLTCPNCNHPRPE